MTDDFVERLRKRVDEAVAREAQQRRAREQEQRARNQAETERLERATALLRHLEQRGQVLRGAAIPGVEYQVAEAEEPWGFTHQVHWTASHPPRGLWVQVDQLGSRLRWAWALYRSIVGVAVMQRAGRRGHAGASPSRRAA